MKISLNWLRRYIDLPETPQEVADALTLLGFEVDDIESTGLPPLENVVVGEVLERQPHPDADRLSVCRVGLGEEIGEKSIVCGATNYKVGDRVPVALPGAVLPGGFKIKRSKLRGVESDGMMCSGKEIGAGEDAAGLLILEGEPPLGQPINEVLTDSDTVFNLEVTPNRPDCLSHLGIARELAAWFKRELCYPEIDGIPVEHARPSGAEIFGGVSVDCEDKCPLYLARVIKGVKIGPSPDWMKKLLVSIGLRPINNVVDVTNFVMHELGNPLHAFDARDIKGGRIRVRMAASGEPMTTLDEVERKLSSRMMVIADEERPLAVAGVMGGLNSEVKPDTTDIVLEVAFFDPPTIRWVSKNLGLSTDSSYRFERGVDPRSLEYAADRAVQLILDTAGGELCSNSYMAGKTPSWETEIIISPDWIRKNAGFEITDDEIESSLESLELSVAVSDEDEWRISIPSYRGDLHRPIDLLEEVLRMYGTHRIPSGQVRASAVARNDDPVMEFTRSAQRYLMGQNFAEAVNYTLRPFDEQKNWSSNVSAEELAIKNPISEDQTQLRHSLLPGLLDTLRTNQQRRTGATRFFETGRTFLESDGRIMELVSVAFVECAAGRERSWKEANSDDFYDAKKRIEDLARLAGVDLSRLPIKPVEVNTTAWQEDHSASLNEPRAGVFARFGLMSLARVKEMDVEGEVFAGIISFLPERLKERKRVQFKPFSSYPSTSKDLALVVDANELAGDVVKTVSKIADKAAKGRFDWEGVNVFDVYEGSGLGEGKKSIAVSMTFRASDRTLKDKEVNEVFETIQKQVKDSTPYTVRD